MLAFNPRPLQGNVNPSKNTTKPMSSRQISSTIKLKTFNYIFQIHFKHNISAFIYYSVQNLKGFLMVYRMLSFQPIYITSVLRPNPKNRFQKLILWCDSLPYMATIPTIYGNVFDNSLYWFQSDSSLNLKWFHFDFNTFVLIVL